ncbi:glycosyltransferase family 8 protein [Fibrobacter sp.]|uniref:glycosyltransferase family 8 protein n=1 Tax=Fibrobacter sp. TaxID=35828 RepID=UPI00386D1EE1
MIEIVLCTDDNYVMPTSVLINSISVTNPETEIHYNIVSSGLSDSAKRKLSNNLVGKKACIDFYTANQEILNGCPIRPGEHISIASYFRLLLPTILPKNIDKVLYMDGDTVCVDEITSLWNTSLENFAAAAVPDMHCDDIRILNRLSLTESCEYYNAGIMLINLDWWRKNDVQNKSIYFATHNKDICTYHDQDVLNVILQGAIKTLSIRYNFQEHFLEKKEDLFIDKKYYDDLDYSLQNPVIIHYTGQKKPWHNECFNPLKDVWRFFFYMSEWRKQKFTNKLPLKNHILYLVREFLSRWNIMKSANPYKGIDYSNLLNNILKKLHN